MATDLPAAVAEAAGMLPEPWPWIGASDNRGRFLELTPDVVSAVCRALAASLGHTDGQAYWLDVWDGGARLHSNQGPLRSCTWKNPAFCFGEADAGCLLIAHQRAAEAGEAG